jgi:nucleotidyltransferase/DNA polymerase involved in DNA repair
MSIACALIPRFSLLTALSDRRELVGKAVALAPEPGGPQAIGEVSGAAEAFGVRPGMGLGEALARCPRLALVPPDAERAEDAWEATLGRLEGMGAAVEARRAGEAFFTVDGLRRLWGGSAEGVLRQALRAIGGPVKLGAAPSRLCAQAAALQMPVRRRRRAGGGLGGIVRGGFVVVPEGAARAFLSPLSVTLLRERLEDQWERVTLPQTLERLGVRTLGELAALPSDAVADRFGEPGLAALRMAHGYAERLSPREPSEDVAERFELPESASGQQLERILELLVDRLLVNPARRGRLIRRLRLAARLSGGGGWRTEVVLREASANRERLCLALGPKLGELPGPADALTLRALALGDSGVGQHSLIDDDRERRRERIGEAVRHARAAAGREAVLRVLEVDPSSRVPERRATLTPYPEEEL